jgi:DUF1680 family protein
MKGEFQERVLRSVHHLQELNVAEMRMEFTHPDDFWHWGADYMGRWISAMTLLGRYTKEDYGVKEVVSELIGFQKADGSFGPYTDPHDFQEWFGMSRGLVGLLEYYQAEPDPNVLESAVRLGDYYAAHYPDCAPCLYECYSTALEGMAALYRITGVPKYLDTARRIAGASVVFEGLRYSQEIAENGRRTPAAGQVHCQLTTARGLLDLYELTGDAAYFKPVLELHDYISNELLWVSGGIGFYYFRPEENETCADSDWLRLNLQLWRLTGEPRFMDLAERILLNQLYFNQADNGGFCYLRGLQNRAGAVFDACCSHHAPRALYEVLRHIYASNGRTIWVNLFMEGEAVLELENSRIQLSSECVNEAGQAVFTLNILEAPSHPLRLQLRIPIWSGQPGLALNGAGITSTMEGGCARIERAWMPGDRLEARFPMQVQVLRGQSLGGHILSPDDAALFYGPRLFCLNDSLNPAVRLHLVRLKLLNNVPDGLTIQTPDRIEAVGVTPDRANERLVFSPLGEIGGTPSGSGRIHTVRSPYYKVWIPVEAPSLPKS